MNSGATESGSSASTSRLRSSHGAAVRSSACISKPASTLMKLPLCPEFLRPREYTHLSKYMARCYDGKNGGSFGEVWPYRDATCGRLARAVEAPGVGGTQDF